MRICGIARILVVSFFAAAASMASARSVSYANEGDCFVTHPTLCSTLCSLEPSFINVPFDRCAGIYHSAVSHVGNLTWCTYTPSENNSFFFVADRDDDAGTIVFRRNLRGPVSLQFNGVIDDGDPLNATPFNVTFGFSQGFDRGAELTYDFSGDLIGDLEEWGYGGIVSTISIHLGEFDFPPPSGSTPVTSGGTGAPMSPLQAHKCQDPGSARN